MTRTLVATPDPEPRRHCPGFVVPHWRPAGLVLTGNATTSNSTSYTLTITPRRKP